MLSNLLKFNVSLTPTSWRVERNGETLRGGALVPVDMPTVGDAVLDTVRTAYDGIHYGSTLAPEGKAGCEYELVGEGAWITVGNMSVHVHKTADGVIADIWPLEGEGMANAPLASAGIVRFEDVELYAALDAEKEEAPA